jgi:serine/threonine-protein kinase
MLGRPGIHGAAFESERDGLPVVVKLLTGRQDPIAVDIETIATTLDRLAAISSPYIVPVVDYGVDRGAPGGPLPWIAMSRIVGVEPLDRVLVRGGDMDRDWVHSVLLHVARGLSDLHAARVMHCEVSPANVLVDVRGHAWLAGFEVARRLDVASSAGSDDGVSEGSLCMAPEQLVGAMGPPADLWALGVLAHELLTGRHPLEDYASGGPAAHPPGGREAWMRDGDGVRHELNAPYAERFDEAATANRTAPRC